MEEPRMAEVFKLFTKTEGVAFPDNMTQIEVSTDGWGGNYSGNLLIFGSKLARDHGINVTSQMHSASQADNIIISITNTKITPCALPRGKHIADAILIR